MRRIKVWIVAALFVPAMLVWVPTPTATAQGVSSFGAAGATGATGATGPAPSGTGVLYNLTSATPSAVTVFQRQSADVAVTNSTTLQSLTGVSYSLASGVTYVLSGNFIATPSAVGGSRYQVTYSGTSSASAFSFTGTNATGGFVCSDPNLAINAPFSCNDVSAEAVNVVIRGSFVTTSVGTLTIQYAQQVAAPASTSTAKAGSFVEIWPMP